MRIYLIFTFKIAFAVSYRSQSISLKTTNHLITLNVLLKFGRSTLMFKFFLHPSTMSPHSPGSYPNQRCTDSTPNTHSFTLIICKCELVKYNLIHRNGFSVTQSNNINRFYPINSTDTHIKIKYNLDTEIRQRHHGTLNTLLECWRDSMCKMNNVTHFNIY